MSKSISPMLFLMPEAKPFRALARSLRSDEFAVGYSLAVCSPAWPASASPAGIHLQTAGSYLSTVSSGKISNWTRRHGQGKISTSGVGQIRVSKWARPEYQTHAYLTRGSTAVARGVGRETRWPRKLLRHQEGRPPHEVLCRDDARGEQWQTFINP